MILQSTVKIETDGRGFYDLTSEVQLIVAKARFATGIAHVFLRHTSASLTISENADPAVLNDLESFMSRLVRDGDPMFTHTAEGPDDMSAHVRSILTKCDLTLPVVGGRCALGTWQGIYLWEHRQAAHTRELIVTVQGAE